MSSPENIRQHQNLLVTAIADAMEAGCPAAFCSWPAEPVCGLEEDFDPWEPDANYTDTENCLRMACADASNAPHRAVAKIEQESAHAKATELVRKATSALAEAGLTAEQIEMVTKHNAEVLTDMNRRRHISLAEAMDEGSSEESEDSEQSAW